VPAARNTCRPLSALVYGSLASSVVDSCSESTARPRLVYAAPRGPIGRPSPCMPPCVAFRRRHRALLSPCLRVSWSTARSWTSPGSPQTFLSLPHSLLKRSRAGAAPLSLHSPPLPHPMSSSTSRSPPAPSELSAGYTKRPTNSPEQRLRWSQTRRAAVLHRQSTF
jgi:hypothetical protein